MRPPVIPFARSWWRGPCRAPPSPADRRRTSGRAPPGRARRPGARRRGSSGPRRPGDARDAPSPRSARLPARRRRMRWPERRASAPAFPRPRAPRRCPRRRYPLRARDATRSGPGRRQRRRVPRAPPCAHHGRPSGRRQSVRAGGGTRRRHSRAPARSAPPPRARICRGRAAPKRLGSWEGPPPRPPQRGAACAARSPTAP